MTSQLMLLAEMFQKAVASHAAGNLQEAERLYLAMLQVQPKHPAVNHNLGVLAVQMGRPASGVAYFKTAVEQNPQDEQFLVSYISVLTNMGRIEEAQDALNNRGGSGLSSNTTKKLRKIIENKIIARPFSYENLIHYIQELFFKKMFIEAEEKCKEFIETYPTDAFGYNALGLIFLQLENFKKAINILQKGALRATKNAELYNSLGMAFKRAGVIDKAILNYKKALEIDKNYVEANYNIGKALQELNRHEDAIPYYKNALIMRPQFAEAYNNMGVALQKLGLVDEAIVNYNKVLTINPNSFETFNNIGNVFQNAGRLDDAITNYRKALAINPTYYEAYNNIGNVFQSLGQDDAAIQSYTKALEVKPDHAEAYYNMLCIQKYSPDSSIILKIKKIISSSKHANSDKMHAYFSLGCLYNKNKDYDNAFINYKLGHDIRYNLNKYMNRTYDHAKMMRKFATFKNVFTQQFFTDRKAWGLSTHTPIFIVGFPRSGTSLVEQILASHSSVFGAGELKDIAQLANTVIMDEIGIANGLATLRRDTVMAMAEKYLTRIEAISGNAHYVVDKMPHNFENLWLISLLFPKSTILHCTRSPEDTCLSCYFNKFTEQHAYIDSMTDLAKQYKYYLRMMMFWKSILPTTIHDISYEQLVTDSETKIRKLLEICSLDYEEKCLEFYKTKRTVMTASASQVRNKMYTSSIGKWKRYERFLGPLLDELYTD